MLENTVYVAAEQVLREIELQSKKQFLPIIGPEKGTVLTRVIRETQPRRVLEVGTLIGYSAILMGKYLPANAEIVTIEIHADEAQIAKENIQRAKIPPKIEVIVGDAKKIIPELTGFFDMVFIDAEKTEYLTYLQLAEPKLLVGSVIVADNAGIFADQMHDYLAYVRSSGKYKSHYEAFGKDGVEVSIKL